MEENKKKSQGGFDFQGKMNVLIMLVIAVVMVGYGIWIFMEMSAWENGGGGNSIRIPRILYFIVTIGEEIIEGSGKWLLSGLMILAGILLGYRALAPDDEAENEGTQEQ